MSEEHRRPKEVEPSVTDIFKNFEYWNKRKLSYLGDDIYFDQEIRTGVCYFQMEKNSFQKRDTIRHIK